MLGSLSARDMYLLLRSTDISPSLEELLEVFETLSQSDIGVLNSVKKVSFAENITYILKNGKEQ